MCGNVWTPQVPTESSRNLLSEPSRFGPSLVFVSVRMTNTRDSARPHGIPACQAAQLVVFWLETGLGRAPRRRTPRGRLLGRGAEPGGVCALSPLAAARLCVPTTPTWHRRFAAGTLSPFGPRSSRSNSTSSLRPGRTVPIPLQARGVEPTWSREGLNGDRHNSRSNRQQQMRRRSTAWPRAGFRGRRLPRHRPPARAPSGDPRQGRRHGPWRRPTSDQDGPEPGHLIEEARSEQPGGRCERSDGERTGPECREGRGEPRGSLSRMAEGELGRRPEDVLRAARREVSTGTN